MKSTTIRIRNVSALGAGLMLLFGSATAALGANIELGAVGNDTPNFVWCITGEHKAVPRQYFSVTFRGRSTLPRNEIGRISLANESIAFFEWQEVLDPDPDESPTLTFTQTMAPLTGPDLRRLRVRAMTRPGLYYIEFVGVDSTGSFSGRARGCLVEVVNELPDVEVISLGYDATPPGGSGRTVRMTIRNNMSTSAQPLAVVPWSFSLSRQQLSPGGNRVTETQFAAGAQTDVPPGSTFQVTAQDSLAGDRQISATDGVIGRVDRSNFIGENDPQRANNEKRIGRNVPATPPAPAHTCESGFTEVTTTQGGALGCTRNSTAPPPCAGFFSSIAGFFTGSCSNGTVAYNCSTRSDCDSNNICPTSGATAGKCTPGHVP